MSETPKPHIGSDGNDVGNTPCANCGHRKSEHDARGWCNAAACLCGAAIRQRILSGERADG